MSSSLYATRFGDIRTGFGKRPETSILHSVARDKLVRLITSFLEISRMDISYAATCSATLRSMNFRSSSGVVIRRLPILNVSISPFDISSAVFVWPSLKVDSMSLMVSNCSFK